MALGPGARSRAPEGKPGVSGKSILDLTPDLCFENHFTRETGLLRPSPSGRTGLSEPDTSLPRAPCFLRYLLRLWSNCDFVDDGALGPSYWASLALYFSALSEATCSSSTTIWLSRSKIVMWAATSSPRSGTASDAMGAARKTPDLKVSINFC